MATAYEKLGQILIHRGVVTRTQFDACVLDHAKAAQTGKPGPLSAVIVGRGFAERAPLAEALRSAGALPFTCLKCDKASTLPLETVDAAPTCPHCGGALEYEESGPVVSREAPTPKPAAPAPKAAAAPSPPPQDVLDAAKDPKRKLGKYTLLSELGRGGYAVVYKAWDELLRQYVALKILRVQDVGLPDGSQDLDLQEFFREARTAVKLSHPNIVRIFELGRHDDRHFLSMELIDGPNFAELLKHERGVSRGVPFYANPTRYLRILRDVALALDYAHRQTPPIVHRDVKPQNILVDKTGRACVVDFGLAKELRPEGGNTLTLSGTTKGTPCYMSPEQATGKTRILDGRTDVYSLGAVFYELLAGQPPFSGPTSRDILNKVVNEDPPRPGDVLKSRGSPHKVHPDLERICLRAMEKDPERRYPSARALGADLDRFLSGKEVQARDVPGYERALRWARRRLPVVVSVGVAAVMAFVATVAVLRSRSGPERVVERVYVTDEAEAQYRKVVREIDALVAAMTFDAAAKVCESALRTSTEGSQKEALRRRLDELSLQADLLRGLVERVQKARSSRAYDRFTLKSGPPLDAVEVFDATPERIFLHRGDKTLSVEWGGVAPAQVLTLAEDYWPSMDGRASLALGVWCLRNDLTNDAAVFLNRPDTGASDAQTKRYRAELTAKDKELSAKSKTGDADLDQQVARLLAQAEKAASAGDAVIARARYERVLAIKPDDPDAAAGLTRVAAAEAAKTSAAPEPRPSAKVETPKPEVPRTEAPKPAAPAKAVATAPSPAAAAQIDSARRKIQEGKWDEAVLELGEVIRSEPGAVEPYVLRGALGHFRGEYAASMQDMNRALELDPGQTRCHIVRGLSYYNVGRWASAVTEFRAGVEPDHPDYNLPLNVWLARAHLGEIEDANRELRDSMAGWKPDVPNVAFYRTIGEFLLGTKAESALLNAAQKDGTTLTSAQQNCLALFEIATRRLVTGDKAGAAQYFQKCLDTNIQGFNVDLASRLELDRMNGKPMPPLDTPAAAKAPADPGPNLPPILSLAKAPGPFSAYGKVRGPFAEALRDREPAKAATLLADFERSLAPTPDAATLRTAAKAGLARLASGTLADPAVVQMARAAEDWLAANDDSLDVFRGFVFDVRDLALIALAYADFDEGLARLSSAGVAVPLQSGKKGGFRKTPKGLVKYELMEAGGQTAEVGSQASLRGDAGPRIAMRDIVSVLRADRARRGGDDFRGKLTDFLLLAYDGKALTAADAPETKEARATLSAADWKRLRMDEYLGGLATRGVPTVDLFSPSNREHWRLSADARWENGVLSINRPKGRAMGIFTDPSEFETHVVLSGSRIDVEFRVLDPSASPRLGVALFKPGTNTELSWVVIDPRNGATNGRLAWRCGSFEGGVEIPLLGDQSLHTLSYYIHSPVIAVTLDGRPIGRTWGLEDPSHIWSEGVLRIGARGGTVQVTRLRVSEAAGGVGFGIGGTLSDTNRFRDRWRNHDALLSKNGGSAATEAAVLSALKWLARHQNADGGWSADRFMDICIGGRCGGPGERDADAGLTALALLAFEGAGYTPLSREEFTDPTGSGRMFNFGDVVKRGLIWLLAHQGADGCLGEHGWKYMYSHAMGTLCLGELYGMTGAGTLQNPTQNAVKFLVAAQNPGKGWRYSSQCNDNDTSVTGWAVRALDASIAGETGTILFPKSCYDGALNWLYEASEPNGYYQVGYNARSTGKVFEPGKNEQFDHHATMSAIGIVMRLAISKKKTDPALNAWNLLVSDLPEWKTNKTDFYYWHWGTEAMFLVDGPDGSQWRKWNEAMKTALVQNQRSARDGCKSGSWDPENERWGASGGRLYTTAMGAITLETYYRLTYALPPPAPKK